VLSWSHLNPEKSQGNVKVGPAEKTQFAFRFTKKKQRVQ
jgi:hypothetical protein